MSEWPSQKAWELLDEFESDPVGYGSIDVDRLLEAWEVTEALPGRDTPGYRARRHRNLPDFVVYYPVLPELAPPVVEGICRSLRELHRRLVG